MSDYIKIQKGKNGELAISRSVFEEIASETTNRVSGASVSKTKKTFKLSRPVTVSFRKDGKVEVSISISLKKGLIAADICKAIQEEVASSLLAYCESIPFVIEIKVASIID